MSGMNPGMNPEWMNPGMNPGNNTGHSLAILNKRGNWLKKGQENVYEMQQDHCYGDW